MEVDFSELAKAGLAERVDEVLRHDFNAQVWAAAERQRRLAARYHLHRPAAQEGLGEQTLVIDPVFDAYWRQCYGHNYTDDKDLVKFLVKRNPEIGVRSRGTKVMAGWRAPERRFIKRYGEG